MTSSRFLPLKRPTGSVSLFMMQREHTVRAPVKTKQPPPHPSGNTNPPPTAQKPPTNPPPPPRRPPHGRSPPPALLLGSRRNPRRPPPPDLPDRRLRPLGNRHLRNRSARHRRTPPSPLPQTKTNPPSQWLKVLNLPTPAHLITAESVTNGKPDPACYRLGRERLGLAGDDKQLLVLEDAPAGIRAGKAAGCKVIGLVTSHTVEEVLAAGPDWVVRDLESVRVVATEEGEGGMRVRVEIRDALVVG